MAESFQYPPELFKLLVDTIPLLCKSKRDVILFFRGAGVIQSDLIHVETALRTDQASINKFEIARDVLTKVNIRGDNGLAVRREILKRVVEFESFETCWENDQFKAKGLVSSIREVVNKKDSFTRMKHERDLEHQQNLAKRELERNQILKKQKSLEEISQRLNTLFTMDDKPHERGKLLESILNDLFRTYDIHIYEDFRRRDPETGVVVEQIDGVIELNGQLHLVEMKWLKSPVGVPEFTQHIGRLFFRANAHGILIATNGYTEAVISQCRDALSQKTLFLCSLQEIVMLLYRQDDLVEFLKKKSRAAILDKNPFLEILS
ncbi:restriction endonuclease [Acinetobacter pittii]|uniref:restriction endonuclease n=1 Tax=Acinetobacter pittii TaxID=48296 RepID=UPI000F73A46E|nr:restriction endonuclease [Acinetobacter pittii]RSO16337.1 restriction endonuclease [Acinetobacter pittii]